MLQIRGRIQLPTPKTRLFTPSDIGCFPTGALMRSVLENLEPKAVWKHFDAIASIPRPSKKEEAARNYVLGEAKRLGLEATVDKVGNVVVRKPAAKGRESAPPTALQGHLDMVCEKNEGTAFDFDKDPIGMRREGEWLYGQGTTLGSDNGIGVA